MDNDGWIPGQWIYEEWRDAIDLRGSILAQYVYRDGQLQWTDKVVELTICAMNILCT